MNSCAYSQSGKKKGENNEAFYLENVDMEKNGKIAQKLREVEEYSKETEKREDEKKEIDPWALPEFKTDAKLWQEMTKKEKVIHVLWTGITKPLLLIALLYFFICSLSFLSSAFRLLGGRTAGQIFRDSEVLANPVAGLVIGVLATVLVQSSSTSTSITITMVGEGLLTVKQAIPIIMGANIGTSVTNTIVSMGQIIDKDDFRRAFAGATIHDMFNWLAVLVLLPIEAATGYLYHLTTAMTKGLELTSANDTNPELLKKITKPFTKIIIELNKKIITHEATKMQNESEPSMLKICKDSNKTVIKCGYLFEYLSSWEDWAMGLLLLFISLLILCLCLMFIVKLLHSLLRGSIAKVIRKLVNQDFPGTCSFVTGYLAILIGAGLTMLVQSSSIFTSSITPLVGLGIISIERMYPLTLGSNIGTTTTGILAAIAQDDHLKESLQVALCHLFFNLTAILFFYPVPFTRFPINLAKFLGNTTAKYRWFAIMYLIFMFFVFPAIVLALSFTSVIALIVVLVPVILLVITVAIIKTLQAKKPHLLPKKLQNWKFLPEWMRSLAPYDRVFRKIFSICKKIRHAKRDSVDLGRT
ncbi:sodium-dependent phosphate transport protein 2B isoform X2 [Octopus bimaculoides]|uniref:Sodium-dependent phosphate transport protein 2B n=1 Tax=Octopus bimaculoides TaxID=37653 RepID=A0A0L8G352_OCTBM|nr:sodium-dependent phosphate transport protein 2B isoform X2 [Octopus bimaculoides]